MSERNYQIKKDNYARVMEFLRSNPCIDCGEDDIVVLDFDHVRGTKKSSISSLLSSAFNWSRIQEEIDKCEIRCSNCHRRATARRSGWRKYAMNDKPS